MPRNALNTNIIFVDDVVDMKIENHVNTTIVYVDLSLQSVLEPEERTFTFVFSPEQIQLLTNTMKNYYKVKK